MTTIEEIKARRDEYEDVRYQSYSGDLTEDASVDFDYLISSIENMAPVLQTYRDELARLQAECAALKAANADLHLIVDRTPEGDRHGRV